jgi:hypothetical protein
MVIEGVPEIITLPPVDVPTAVFVAAFNVKAVELVLVVATF